MHKNLIQKLKELNIYSLQPYLIGAENKDKIKLKFEQPYFLLRSQDFYDETQINKNIRKKSIIAYLRLNGVHHFIYYIKSDDLQSKLYNYVANNSCYELIDTLEIRKTDSIYILHKNLPIKPTTSSPTSSDDELDEPTSSEPTSLPNLFNPEKSHDKPNLYLYKALLPYINNYKDFQILCYLLHILKVSGTLATHGNIANISFKDLTALLPNSLKRDKREKRERKSKLNKSFDYFLRDIEPYTIGIYEENNILEIPLNEDFVACLSNPPYITVPLDFVGQFNKNNYNFLMYFLQYLFSVNPKKTFIVKISTQELLKKTDILNSTTHSTIATIVARVNNYFNILFQHHITPRPYVIVANDIKKNTILKIELKRFQIAKDFNPIVSTGMLDNEPGG